MEEIRGRSLRLVTALDLLWASLALIGGVVAAVLVQRHQRVVEQLRRVEQARASELEQFAGRVAHDVVSPLAPVSPSLQVLSHKLDGDPAAQRAVAAIRRSLDRVSMIVDELLRFARSGAQPAPGERADIARVLESVRDELTPDAQQSGVTLRFEPAPQVEVACGEGAMLVVIHNLVRNAIKYIGDGPRRLVVTRAVVAAQSVRLSVQDSGPGLPVGMEQAVFAPYVRAPGTGAPGIGLGLATVKRIVESRRGRVGVWSEPRKGATFWVDLPLAPVKRTAGLRRGSRLWVAALTPLVAGWTVAAQAKEVPSGEFHDCPKSRLRPLAGDHARPTLPPGIPVAKSVASDVLAVIDQFGPSDLSKVGADFDPADQRVLLSPGNSTAQLVFGPGTKKLRAKGVESTRYLLRGAGHGDVSFMGDAKAGAPWSTEEVMGLIVTFLGRHLES
jgi:signal transduction histidine kinase